MIYQPVRYPSLPRLYKEVQEQVQALERDLEKASYERENTESDYNQKVAEEKLRYEENVSFLLEANSHLAYFGQNRDVQSHNSL